MANRLTLRRFLKASLLAACLTASGIVDAEPNLALQRALADDQIDRVALQNRAWDDAVTRRDQARGSLVRAELAAGRLRDPRDYHAGALILLHGTSPDDYRLASAFAWMAYSMAEDKASAPAREAAQLYAMCWDRLMVSLNQPQWYSTQRQRDPSTHRPGKLFPTNPKAASPEDKARFGGS